MAVCDFEDNAQRRPFPVKCSGTVAIREGRCLSGGILLEEPSCDVNARK